MTALRTRSYPSMTHLVNEYRRIGGNQGGIIPGSFISVTEHPGEPRLRAMTANMPAYHKIMLDDPTMEMQYHLSGYGLYPEEALVRLLGESVERYGAMVAMRAFQDRVRYATYAEMAADGPCLPLEHLGLYDAEQQRRVAAMMPRYAPEPPSPDDVIGWIRCPSLVRPGEDVWVPAQLFFLGFTASPAHGDKMFTPSFSTGTAAHVDTTKALRNALIESVQIDAFTLNWYTSTPGRRVVLDDDRLAAHLATMGLGPDSAYEVVAVHLTRPELPLPTIGVYLQRRDERIPYLAFGVQGDPDPVHAVLRGAQEAIAILGMGMYGAVFDTETFHFANTRSAFTDLDTNVWYYACPEDGAAKRDLVASRIEGEVALSALVAEAPAAGTDREVVADLVSAIATVSRWAVYLDITPAELHDSHWRVMRVLIPELCSMCLPGLPPRAHPRIVRYGGVTNDRPHPLP